MWGEQKFFATFGQVILYQILEQILSIWVQKKLKEKKYAVQLNQIGDRLPV